jgi:preprotein translocase subunit SecB
MKDSVVQSKIKLSAFKAVKVEFECKPISENVDLEEKFDLELQDAYLKASPKHFIKVFLINFTTQIANGEEFVRFHVEFHTIFECSDVINDDFINSDFVKISAPAIGFPFVRSFISTVSVQAGLPPIILPSINFIQFNKGTEAQKNIKK